ncbi:uncharacterized protein B0H18DRAFT_1118416 [Fomitopsis serialis]|uniref:uncharacterized protein n=1 Tax=Fomitopsis serialis TaxID=139415 RepID=UPI002007DB42|nr:uncharacterized protein B0H18DRAFT_1118416 [Neoantrodia serialis]KAH9927610.1 hypothetical protein B0H18DRAFT_1118416 [Neoantrodia serialis]
MATGQQSSYAQISPQSTRQHTLDSIHKTSSDDSHRHPRTPPECEWVDLGDGILMGMAPPSKRSSPMKPPRTHTHQEAESQGICESEVGPSGSQGLPTTVPAPPLQSPHTPQRGDFRRKVMRSSIPRSAHVSPERCLPNAVQATSTTPGPSSPAGGFSWSSPPRSPIGSPLFHAPELSEIPSMEPEMQNGKKRKRTRRTSRGTTNERCQTTTHSQTHPRGWDIRTPETMVTPKTAAGHKRRELKHSDGEPASIPPAAKRARTDNNDGLHTIAEAPSGTIAATVAARKAPKRSRARAHRVVPANDEGRRLSPVLPAGGGYRARVSHISTARLSVNDATTRADSMACPSSSDVNPADPECSASGSDPRAHTSSAEAGLPALPPIIAVASFDMPGYSPMIGDANSGPQWKPPVTPTPDSGSSLLLDPPKRGGKLGPTDSHNSLFSEAPSLGDN